MTLPGWVGAIAPFQVERREVRRPGDQPYLNLVDKPSGCLHTTEGYDPMNALIYNSSKGFASHFYVGKDRIIQARPLNTQASSLLGGEATNKHFIQVEAVGFSQQQPWTFDAATLRPLTALLGYLRDEVGIPLARPRAWPDDMSDLKGQVWATSDNSRRRSGLALVFHGWLQHLEIPQNSHWDCGALQWHELFAGIPDSRKDDVNFNDWHRGWQAHENGETPPDKAGWERQGWQDRSRLIKDASEGETVTIDIPSQSIKATVTKA